MIFRLRQINQLILAAELASQKLLESATDETARKGRVLMNVHSSLGVGGDQEKGLIKMLGG